MDPVEIIIFSNPEQDARRPLEKLLQRYDSQAGVQINDIGWNVAWSETLKISLYKAGGDVSQVGAPWVYNFTTMKSLHALTKEVPNLGGEAAYLPAVWQFVYAEDHQEVWAVPWFVDVRVIYYWRDMLEKAGVDEATAFQTSEQMEETFRRLQAGGIATPWAVPTVKDIASIASWIWGAGGELASADGKRVLFNQPEALTGIQAYFALHRYLPREAQDMSAFRAFQFFDQRRVAATIGPPWYYAMMRDRGVSTDVLARIGFASPPGPPYVGGSNLMVWKHTRHPKAAINLIRFLVTPEAQAEYANRLGYLPARLDALKLPPFSTDRHYQAIIAVLHQGRSYPNFPRWALMEDSLAVGFGQVWMDVLTHPGEPLRYLISRRLEPVSRRLDAILAA